MKIQSCKNCYHLELSDVSSVYNKCGRSGLYCSTELESDSYKRCKNVLHFWKPNIMILSNDEIKEMIHKRKMQSSLLYRIKFYITGIIASFGDKNND